MVDGSPELLESSVGAATARGALTGDTGGGRMATTGETGGDTGREAFGVLGVESRAEASMKSHSESK